MDSVVICKAEQLLVVEANNLETDKLCQAVVLRWSKQNEVEVLQTAPVVLNIEQ